MAEAVMLELGRAIGRQHAHDVVYDAAQAAVAKGASFADLLLADPRVTDKLPPQAIRGLLDPAGYAGLCSRIAIEAAARARAAAV